MKTDSYTKFILTLIAIGLFLNAAINLIPKVHAYGRGTEVQVTNYETDITAVKRFTYIAKIARDKISQLD